MLPRKAPRSLVLSVLALILFFTLACSKQGEPASASANPAAILNRVDLPEPLRPTRQRRSPAPTASSTRSSSCVLPSLT